MVIVNVEIAAQTPPAQRKTMSLVFPHLLFGYKLQAPHLTPYPEVIM